MAARKRKAKKSSKRTPRISVKSTVETLYCVNIGGEQSGCFSTKSRAQKAARKAEKDLRKEIAQQKRDLKRELKRLGG